jgi:hypothetical protein
MRRVTNGFAALLFAFPYVPCTAEYLPDAIAPKCRYGDEIRKNSNQAMQAERRAWSFVANQLGWSTQKRPDAVLCALGDRIIVDYRAHNSGVLVEYVILDRQTYSVLLMRLSEH